MDGQFLREDKGVRFVVLCGALSSEREVSLLSGANVASLLSRRAPVRLESLGKNELPANLDPNRDLIFSLVHGEFGEDGQLQSLLESGGFSFVGSDSSAARLTMDKTRTKIFLESKGIPQLRQHLMRSDELACSPSFFDICSELGTPRFFVKPNDRGSSLFCFPVESPAVWKNSLEAMRSCVAVSDWICEAYCPGQDLTVGLLHGRALPPLLVQAPSEFLDYGLKYEAGRVKHLCPAPIGDELLDQVSRLAEKIFDLAGCRDWARVDFRFSPDRSIHFLEVNTTPGFTATSFFPDIARAAGFTTEEVCWEILGPALKRLLGRRNLKNG